MRRDIFFLAVVLSAAACGDDSPNSDEDAARDEDRDGGDSESKELAEARETNGVSATQARADLLIEALCRKAPRCSDQTEAACAEVYNDGWMNLIANQVSDACKDAELDRIACLSDGECDQLDACEEFAAPIASNCPEDAGMP